MGGARSAYGEEEIWVGKRWGPLGFSGIDERIILRWIFRKWDVWVWIRSNRFRIGTGGGHL